MNIYGMLILAALLAITFIDTIAEILNLRALSPRVPEEFADVYDAKEYSSSQEYTRVRTKFGFVTTAFNLAVTLIFWFTGGFDWLDGIIRNWGWSAIVSGLVYIGILLACKGVLDLPFNLYATFVIEQRFGFNKTTWQTYISDTLKGLALGVLLGTPLLAGILWFFANAGPAAWLYCWLAVVGFMLIVQYIAPTYIMPLFNKFTPLPEGELNSAIMAYAQGVRFPLKRLFVMDGSRRSTKSNAFFTGFGRNKRIVLFDTLIEKHSVPELVSVLAHEIGHYKKKHILQSLITGIVLAGVEFYLLSIFLGQSELSAAFFMRQSSLYTGLIFFGILFTPLQYLLGIVRKLISRKHEFQADRYAVETTGTAGPLIDALKKLSVSNLSNLTPHRWYVVLTYSHPPLARRIAAIREI